MSKHKIVDGQLLQMNKLYSQLKQKQKEKIGNWMYEAYKKQVGEKLTDEEALEYVVDKINKGGIWIPEHEIEKKHSSKKAQFNKRLAGENVPQHIYQMENILDKAIQKMDALEKKIAEYEEFQSEILKMRSSSLSLYPLSLPVMVRPSSCAMLIGMRKTESA